MSTHLPLPPGTSSARPLVIADARVEALAGLIDYAGLFPPANLDMAGAVAGYRAARDHDANWLLSRFICPAGRLTELAAQLTGTMVAGERPWPLVLLLRSASGADWLASIRQDVAAAVAFEAEMQPAAKVTSAEAKLPVELLTGGADLVDVVAEAALGAAASMGVTTYFEVPLVSDWDAVMPAALGTVEQVRREHAVAVGAKIRCGGVTADLFPSPSQVAAFIVTCRDLKLPFKATAGLHHPFRYDDEHTGFTHHGFFNVLAAAVLADAKELNFAEVEKVIAERDPGNFSLTRRGLRWRDQEASADRVRAARAGSFAGYGSCDFAEPAADLAALGILVQEVDD